MLLRLTFKVGCHAVDFSSTNCRTGNFLERTRLTAKYNDEPASLLSILFQGWAYIPLTSDLKATKLKRVRCSSLTQKGPAFEI